MPGKAGRNRTRQPLYYWNHVAATKLEAQTLAQGVGLQIPTSATGGFKSNLIYPVRRLTIAGKDTAENFTLLLGPLCNQIDNLIIQARVEVLLVLHPEGSCKGCSNGTGCDQQAPHNRPAWSLENRFPSASTYSVSFEKLDEGSLGWTPRMASDDELCTVGGYRRVRADSIDKIRSQGYGVRKHDVKITLRSLERVDGWTKFDWVCDITTC